MMISLKIISDKYQFNRCLKDLLPASKETCYKEECTSLERATAYSLYKSPKEVRTRPVVWQKHCEIIIRSCWWTERRMSQVCIISTRRGLSYGCATHYCSLPAAEGKCPSFQHEHLVWIIARGFYWGEVTLIPVGKAEVTNTETEEGKKGYK